MKGRPTRVMEVLLVEDSPIDVQLIKDALEETKISHRLQVLTDGECAIEFLRKTGVHEGAPTPDLVILDLNLPRKDGREVLAEVKVDPELKRIPVIILSTSKSELDVAKCYDLHVNCFVSKPVDMLQFIEATKSVFQFWLTVAALPPEPSSGVKK